MRPADDIVPTPTVAGYDSPRIVDSDMGDSFLGSDLEFFNAALPHDSPSSPSHILDEDILGTPRPQGLPSDSSTIDPDTLINLGNKHPSGQLPPLPKVASASPPSSGQDSSSDSSRGHKRKSSTSSQDNAAMGDPMMTDDVDMSDWKNDELMMGPDGPNFTRHSGFFINQSSNPLEMDPDFETSNKVMENHFDFDSAASSPRHDVGEASIMSVSSNRPMNRVSLPSREAPRPPQHHNRRSQVSTHSTAPSSVNGFSTQASREVSPSTNMILSQESSPSAFFQNLTPSPTTATDLTAGPMLTGTPANPTWPSSMAFPVGAPSSQSSSSLRTSPYQTSSQSPFTSRSEGPTPVLMIHPTPLKSRVETQIPIKLTLNALPPNVMKLHLPTHTISKPKLLTKPPPSKSPDTYELLTMLVSTSAMQDPEKLKRAFARAAEDNHDDDNTVRGGEEEGEEEEGVEAKKEHRLSSSGGAASEDDDGDESKPQNGGEVKICIGCITRERKRAARKKIKKVEEEESWHQDEHRRVIVFNTQEMKDWAPPVRDAASDEANDRSPPHMPEGAMQVELPMRIACYCRHHNEKLGFQVIFTIKDHEDRLVAQAITSSIMITDDHKTHAAASMTMSAQPAISEAPPAQTNSTQQGAPVFGPPYAAPLSTGPFRTSHSSSDLQSLQSLQNLQNLQQTYSSPYPPATTASTSTFSPSLSRTTSISHTPRNLSRQASPSTGPSHSNKKRKSSGPTKVPSGLAMTRLENAGGNPATMMSTTLGATGPSSLSSLASPYASSFGTGGYAVEQTTASMAPQSQTGPSTPNGGEGGFLNQANRSHSMENLPMGQMFSAPASAHQSRAPSPTSASQHPPNPFQQARPTDATTHGMFSLPLSVNPMRPPTMHKLIPNEGPRTGGVEVTCLGSGFCQGLEVMFGESLATTTTFWGDTTLVCLLPPAVNAGTVPVMFKHELQQQRQQPYMPQMPRQPIPFKYNDDDEQQLVKMVLSVWAQKMTGRPENVRDIALRMVGSDAGPWGASSSSGHSAGDGQTRRAAGVESSAFGDIDVEATLLKFLDLIDLDDSTYQPRLNLRRPSGQTMLHLACSLGLHRFVAALLARGANPDPRDKGGFTPMHFAALHDQPQIVRRLILSGADPTMRSLQGYTPADLATSERVLQSTRRIEHHARTRSGPSSLARQRISSAVSLSALWASPTAGRGRPVSQNLGLAEFEDSDDDQVYRDDHDAVVCSGPYWSRSRQSSRASVPADVTDLAPMAALGGARTDEHAAADDATTASMTAWRSQLTAQLQHLQQTVQWNLPNLPHISALPPLPALPDYQTYLPNPMARRISSLVPSRGPPRPSEPADPSTGPKQADYRWWELFSGSAPPPAYDEIYPQSDTRGADVKKDLAVRTALDTIADQQASELYDRQPAGASSSRAPTASIGSLKVRLGRTPLSAEEQEALRTAHAKKVKKLRSDRNLFFIWIPLLVVIVVAMLKSRLPEVWNGASQAYSYLRDRNRGRLQEV